MLNKKGWAILADASEERRDDSVIEPWYLELEADREVALQRSLTARTWMKTKEVAKYLGLSIGAVYNLVYRGKLRPRRIPGTRTHLFSRQEIDRLLATPGNRR